MTLIIHKNRSIKEMETLSQELASILVGLTPDEAKLVKEDHIRTCLAANKSYNAWEPVHFYGYKNDIHLSTPLALISIKGQVAYDAEDGMHVTGGVLNDPYPSVNIPAFKNIYDSPIGISRLVASTFLSVPDKYKGISPHELEVTHLDGQKFQNHFANLEWSLNKPEEELAVIEETIKLLNEPLPTQE